MSISESPEIDSASDALVSSPIEQAVPRRIIYKEPPVAEALIDFLFEPSQDWKATAFGKFESEVSCKYDGEPEEEKQIGIEVNIQEGHALTQREQFQRMIYPNSNRQFLTTLKQNRLTVNALPPYMGWESFIDLAKWTLDRYVDLFQPKGLRQVGLRYINRIDFSDLVGEEIAIDSMFPTLKGIKTIEGGVAVSVNRSSVTRVDNETGTQWVKVTLADSGGMGIVDESMKATFILDIDAFQRWPEDPIGSEEAIKAVEVLKLLEREAFESSISDELRTRFKQCQ